MRHRAAPSAARTAISRARAVARARKSPATFTDASTSTSSAAPIITSRTGRTLPTMASRTGTAVSDSGPKPDAWPAAAARSPKTRISA